MSPQPVSYTEGSSLLHWRSPQINHDAESSHCMRRAWSGGGMDEVGIPRILGSQQCWRGDGRASVEGEATRTATAVCSACERARADRVLNRLQLHAADAGPDSGGREPSGDRLLHRDKSRRTTSAGARRFQAGFPAPAQIDLASARRVIEQTDVGVSHFTVQLRGEAVRRNVQDPMTRRHSLVHAARGTGAGPGRSSARRCARARPQERDGVLPREAGMSRGSVEIDQQPADSAGDQRRRKRRRQLPGHCQRPHVVAAVGIQQSSVTFE